MPLATIGPYVVSVSLCLLYGALASFPASAAPWQQITPPPGGESCTALTPGRAYLYAAWCAPGDVSVGVYRTPIAAPGQWELLGIVGKPVRDILVGGVGDELVFAAAESDTCIYRSTDGGQHWESGEGGLFTQTGYSLAWNGSRPGYLYAAAGGVGRALSAVYRSGDLGDSWTQISTTEIVNGKPYLAALRNGSDLVYHSFYDIYWVSEAYRSTNAGASWSSLQCGATNDRATRDLDVRPADPMSGCVLLGDTEIGRWQDNDELPSWTGLHETIGLEMPAWLPECAFIAGKDAEGRLQAAWRTWGSSAWLPLNDGFSTGSGSGVEGLYWYFHLDAAPGMPRLFYATHDDGLWMRDVDEVVAGVDGMALAPLALAPVHPNPASGSMTFRLEGAVSGVTGWRVFDAAGRSVLHASGAADRSRSWNGRWADGTPVPAGVYWVRAELPGRSIARSFVIIR